MSPNAYKDEKIENYEEFILRKYVKLFLLSFENEFKENFKMAGISYIDTKPLLNKIILLRSKRYMNHVQDALGKHGRMACFQELDNKIITTLGTLVFENASFNLED